MVDVFDLAAYRKRASVPKRVELLEQRLFELGYITEDMLGVTQRIAKVETTASQMSTRLGAVENSETSMGNRVTTLENKPAPVIPQPSTDMPPQVALSGAAGSSKNYAPADHTHAARVQRKIVTLNASGVATWTFAKEFTAMPSLQYMVFQSSGRPLVVEAQAWVMNGSNYAGVTIKGYRSQNLPAQQQLTLVTLLTGVINGVNALASSLTGFDVFGGSNLNGVSVHMSAGDQM